MNSFILILESILELLSELLIDGSGFLLDIEVDHIGIGRIQCVK